MPPLLRSHRFPVVFLLTVLSRGQSMPNAMSSSSPHHLYVPFLPFPSLSTLWVSAVPGGGEEARERRTRRARKGCCPSGILSTTLAGCLTPATGVPSQRGNSLIPVPRPGPNVHTVFLTPAAWRPSPSLRGSSCLLDLSNPQMGSGRGLWKVQPSP